MKSSDARGRIGASVAGRSAVVLALFIASVSNAAVPPVSDATSDEPRALKVMQALQKDFWVADAKHYADKAGTTNQPSMWADGVLLSALNAAVRSDAQTYSPKFDLVYKSMERSWDFKQKLPGYEPFPGKGDGHDKYYDDNEWVAIALLENYAISNRPLMLARAKQTDEFFLSGWDETLGGGIWWHERHFHDCKNTCSNAPAAVACLGLAQYLSGDDAARQRTMAKQIVEWTTDHLQDKNKLFNDNVSALDGKVSHMQFTYNTALMIRADLGLYRSTGDESYLIAAKEISAAAEKFVKPDTGGYRDTIKFSHLQVEADLAMARLDNDPHLLDRARHAVDADYDAWEKKPSVELIDVASLARELWLLNESHTSAGQRFWRQIDGGVDGK